MRLNHFGMVTHLISQLREKKLINAYDFNLISSEVIDKK